MTRILVIPEKLRAIGAQLQQTSGDLQSVEGRVGSALSGLAWEARQKANVDGQANQARSQARALAARAEEMSRYLERKAQAFEEADGQGVGGVGQVFGAFTEWAQGAPSWWGFPSQQIDAWWNLGGLLGQPFPIQVLRLPVIGGIVVGGLASLTALSMALSEAMQDFVECLRNWWQGKGWKTDEEIRDEKEDDDDEVGDDEVKNDDEVEDDEVPSPQIADPGMNSPWRQIDAPIKNSPEQRSMASYRSVIGQFDVQHSYQGRYRPSDKYPDTRCNIFAGDVMRAMGAPLPTKGDLGVGHGDAKNTDPMTANAMDTNKWLHRETNGWHRIDPNNPDDLEVLKEHLQAGKPALASDPGHIAVLRPDHLPDQLTKDNLGSVHIAQAGAHNYNDIALQNAGYGTAFQPSFFIHD